MSNKDIESSSKTFPSKGNVKTDSYNATIPLAHHPVTTTEKSVPLYSRPPWPEWSDDEINKETWEENESASIFEDITGAILPPSIRPVQWVRPTYLSSTPKMIDWSEKTMDLIAPNIHICEVSEAIRYILSEISELFDYGKDNDFKCEGEDVVYVRNSLEAWNPWDHIYSLCKAGIKGTQPYYNPWGRYFVRLYYMGCWRRITVDDRIPILKDGLIGLPLGQKNELWPLILTKALLKIAYLGADELRGKEIKQFSAISCLTGWTYEWHDITAPISSDELWRDLTDILPKYKQSSAPSHDHVISAQSKKQLDDSAFWLVPPTTNTPAANDYDQDFDEFGEPISTKPGPTPAPSHVVTSPVEEQQHSLQDKNKRKSRKQRKKKDGSDSAVEPLAAEETPTVAESVETTLPPEKSDGSKADGGSKKEKGKKGKGKGKGKKTEEEPQTTTTTEPPKKKKQKKGKGGKEEDSTDKAPSERTDAESVEPVKKEDDVTGTTTGENVEAENAKEEMTTPKEEEKETKLPKEKKGKEKKQKKGKSEEEEEVKLDEKKAKKKKKGDKDNEDVKSDSKTIKKKKAIEKAIRETADALSTPPDEKKGGQSPEGADEVDDGKKKGKKIDKKGKKSKNLGQRNSPPDETIDKAAAEAKIKELKEKMAKRAERLEKQKQMVEGQKQTVKQNKSIYKIPPMQEILMGVQKFSGAAYHSIVTSFEETCGKDLPVTLTVVFQEFPRDMDQSLPAIPSFLYHPVQLYEVRDCPLAKTNDRPPTPLWKTFRWKAWAMKKGIIPMEEDHFKDIIRSVKVHTPFALKTDWYDHRLPLDYKEVVGEGDLEGEGGEEEGQGQEQAQPQEDKQSANSSRNSQDASANTPAVIPSDKIPALEDQKSGANVATDKKAPSKASVMSGATANSTNSNQPIGNRFKSILPGKVVAQDETTPEPTPITDLAKQGATTTTNSSYKDEERGETRVEEVEHSATPIIPDSACGSLWLDVDNIAFNLKKFCKFYTGRTTFGTCFTLRRSSRYVFETPISKSFESEAASPMEITNFHSNPNSRNLTINFGESKTIYVMSHHLDDLEGFDSGFYLLSDSWTEQEMILDLEVLQLSILKKFMDTALEIDPIPADPTIHDDLQILKKLETPKVNITVILEPWDWRNDCCIEAPVVLGTTQTRWTTHVPLPPGRHTFRLWLIQDYPEISTSGISSLSKLESVRRVMESHKRNQITQFSLKIMSKAPICVGFREEIQNYLTNEPVLLLKQSEAFAHNIWILLLSFGKSIFAYGRAITSVRKSYCPAFTEPNKLNKILKTVHASFEEGFVSMIATMNGGRMDHWMVLALRALFLNPCVGHVLPTNQPHSREVARDYEALIAGYKRDNRILAVQKACGIIQRFFRGWRVRRLFHARLKEHKYFPRLEFQIRRVALLLAKNTDSTFSVGDKEKKPASPDIGDHIPLTPPPEVPKPSLVPQPPRWAVDLLRKLMVLHPMLVTIHPHAYCEPLHIKIKDIEGTIPSILGDTEWLPFCRQPICISNETQKAYCEFDLQVHPRDGIMLKVVDNDTSELMPTITNRLFLGRLPVNQLGYTIVCYRWANSSETRPDAYRRPPSRKWKLRLIAPHIQKSVMLKDVTSSQEEESPKGLSLIRFTGYYIPNKELCICRYTIETRQLITYLSIRFQSSNPQAQLHLQIVDLNQNLIVYNHHATGGFLIPSIRIQGDSGNSGGDMEDNTLKIKRSTSTMKPKSQPDLFDDYEESFLSRLFTDPSTEEPPLIQRYLVCIYSENDSWKLSESEWGFSQDQKKKFWKRLMVTKKAPRIPALIILPKQPSLPQMEAATAQEDEGAAAVAGRVTPHLTDVIGKEHSYEDKDNPSEKSAGKRGSRKEKKGKKDMVKARGKLDREKSNQSNINKYKSAYSTYGMADGLSKEEMEVKPPSPPPPPPPKPITPPPVFKEIVTVVEESEPFEEYLGGGYESANVGVNYGGRHSIKIRDSSQPHWTLEFAVDRDQEIEFTSNLRVLNDKLEKLKELWEIKQDEVLAAGLASRVQSVSRPGAYMLADPFTLVQLLTDLENSLYMEESEMEKFTYGELLTPEEASAKAELDKIEAEKVLAEQRASKVRKTVRVKMGRGRKPTRAPPPTPVPQPQFFMEENNLAGDIFPTSHAGSDFNLRDVNEPPNYSIFPIDLSVGSPSLLEMSRKFMMLQSASTIGRGDSGEEEQSLEMEGSWRWNDVLRLLEYPGEGGEYYGEYMGESEGIPYRKAPRLSSQTYTSSPILNSSGVRNSSLGKDGSGESGQEKIVKSDESKSDRSKKNKGLKK